MPFYICPNCKDRSIDIDGFEGMSTQAVACQRCGFGFLFELMDDYYPGRTRASSSATGTGESSRPAAASSS